MSETVFALGPCSLCGRDPAAGFASVGDDWYCHGDYDPEPTCYMRAQVDLVREPSDRSLAGRHTHTEDNRGDNDRTLGPS